MKGNNGNNKRELLEQDTSLLGVPDVKANQILELKLEGWTDRRVAKKVNLAPSTVNKHFHKQIQELHDVSKKNLENLRFQQYLKFDKVIALVWEEFNQRNFKAVDWAKILTRLLAEQSKLYGLNTGSINISLDQRTYEQGQEDLKQEYLDHMTTTAGKAPQQALEDKINSYVANLLETKLSLLLFGTDAPESAADVDLINDILN